MMLLAGGHGNSLSLLAKGTLHPLLGFLLAQGLILLYMWASPALCVMFFCFSLCVTMHLL